jgi:hypothetical protein
MQTALQITIADLHANMLHTNTAIRTALVTAVVLSARLLLLTLALAQKLKQHTASITTLLTAPHCLTLAATATAHLNNPLTRRTLTARVTLSLTQVNTAARFRMRRVTHKHPLAFPLTARHRVRAGRTDKPLRQQKLSHQRFTARTVR